MELSFCIPTYNRADYLKRCLNSILCHNDTDIEIVVQDNCSTDQTPEVVAAISDQRLKFFRNPTNIGGVQNGITLIPKTTGRYLFFLTDDDYLLPDVVSKIKHFINQNDPSFFTAHTKMYLEKRKMMLDYYYFRNSLERLTPVTKDQVAQIVMSAHVLTRVCFKREHLDWELLKKHGDNWYPQMLIAMQMTLKGPVLYLAEPLTVHTWENPTYWGIHSKNMKILNQGIVNMIKSMSPYLDDELLERIIINFFSRRNTFSDELFNLLKPETREKLRPGTL